VECRASGVAHRRALAGGAERLATRSCCHDRRLASSETRCPENLLRWYVLDSPGDHGDIGTVFPDRLDREAVALDCDTEAKTELFQSQVEAERA
jgi:hypothetical protein